MLKIILLLLVCLPSHFLYSQEIHHKPQFGISLTPQLSTIRFENDQLKKSKPSLAYSFEGGLLLDLARNIDAQVGLSFQKAVIRQFDYTPDFPADQMNGEALVYLSYYEFKLEYLAVGIPLGVRLKLGKKPNCFFINLHGHARQIFRSKEALQLNESGILFHQLDIDQFGFEINKTQLLVGTCLGYDFGLKANRRFAIGPTLEYSVSNIIKGQPDDLTPEFIGGYPVFVGLRIFYY